MGAIRISVDGIPELQAALEGIPLYIRANILPPIYQEAGQMVLSAILARTPRQTGRMAGEIGMQTTQVFGEPAVVIRPAYKRVRYTHLVEFGVRPHGGNRGFAGRDFFNGGIDETQDAALDLVTAKVGDAIDAYWAGKGGGQ